MADCEPLPVVGRVFDLVNDGQGEVGAPRTPSRALLRTRPAHHAHTVLTHHLVEHATRHRTAIDLNPDDHIIVFISHSHRV